MIYQFDIFETKDFKHASDIGLKNYSSWILGVNLNITILMDNFQTS